MISKEQIAHDLTMIYMKNRYGIDVSGDMNVNGSIGTGTIETKHYPMASDPQYVKINTGEKGLFGFERKQKTKSGNKVDFLFSEMVQNYYDAYSLFYHLLCEYNAEKENSSKSE